MREEDKLKADEGHVILAYLIDDTNPFEPNITIRRCCIDQWGLVFTPMGMGWSALQGDYKIVPVRQVKIPSKGGIYQHLLYPQDLWWTRRAWDCELWSWLWLRSARFQKGRISEFIAC